MSNINMHLIEEIVPQFHEFLKSEGNQWKTEREEKDKFFGKYFSETEIVNFDEGTLRELIHILWAFNGWTNKDWLLGEMLSSGLPEIKDAFRALIYGDGPISERFDFVKQNVRMMGAACISEILIHSDPKKYPIWNRRSRQGLITLGIDETELPKSSQISGSQYASFCKLAEAVRNQVAMKYPEFSDLFILDFLLYYLSLRKIQDAEIVTPAEDIETDEIGHGEVINQILELGDGLGFEVQKEFSVMRGCRIDALWRSRVANLGTIAYAFEVQRRGSRDSAILNLQRVRRDPSIQKVVIVSSKSELDKFREEIASLDEEFRTSVGYFEVKDLHGRWRTFRNSRIF